MRLIVDTTIGLAIIDKGCGFDVLDAVIIGTLPMPEHIGILDDGYISLAPEKLSDLFDPQNEREHDELRALVAALQRENETITGGEGLRVPIVKWLS
jgi:hypothetical protein